MGGQSGKAHISQPRNVNLEQEAGSEIARSQHLKGRHMGNNAINHDWEWFIYTTY